MISFYYEFTNMHGNLYWVQNNIREWADGRAKYNTFLMCGANRVWANNDGGVTFVKNRYGVIPVDLHEFDYIKSHSMNMDKISIRKFSDGAIYVSFPLYRRDFIIPEGLEEWVVHNTEAGPEWAMIDQRRCGLFLSEEDATAFKLKWM